MKYNRVWRLKNITAALLLLNSMDCNIVEENGKGMNAFIERYSPLIVNQRREIFPIIMIQIYAGWGNLLDLWVTFAGWFTVFFARWGA